MPKIKSRFENEFSMAKGCLKVGVDPVDAGKPRKSPFRYLDDTLLTTVSMNGHNYDFWQGGGTSQRDLEKDVWIKGPSYDYRNREWSEVKGLLGFIKSDGKIRYMVGTGESGKITKQQMEDAVEKFWKKLGIMPVEAQGWSYGNSFRSDAVGLPGIYILRRKANGYLEEYAIARPRPHGRTYMFFGAPRGPKTPSNEMFVELSYEAAQKIPTELKAEISRRFTEEDLWNPGYLPSFALMKAWSGKLTQPTISAT
jgi:hypothetical protein